MLILAEATAKFLKIAVCSHKLVQVSTSTSLAAHPIRRCPSRTKAASPACVFPRRDRWIGLEGRGASVREEASCWKKENPSVSWF